MASIISSLSLSEQASCLREFIAARGANLSEAAAQNVCRSVGLHRPAESKAVARKLVAALAAHGIVIKHSNALEALAKICGQSSWMRTLQASLPFGNTVPEHVVYALQAVKDGETYLSIETFQTMSQATDRLLKVVADEWPTTTGVSLGTLGFGKEMLLVELEHPTASWLQFKLCRFVGSEAKAEMGALPPSECRVFCERLTRALEYTYPGLLVLNSMRSSTLAPEFYLCPEVHQRATGQKVTCWGDLELLPVLDSFRGQQPGSTVGQDVLSFDSENGPIDITPTWTSNSDSRLLPGGLAADQLDSLLKRLARLRRLIGGSVTQHLGRVMTLAENAENFFPVSKDALEAAMREVNLTPKQLGLLVQVPLNVVQRVLKYAYAHETFVPQLSKSRDAEFAAQAMITAVTRGDGRSTRFVQMLHTAEEAADGVHFTIPVSGAKLLEYIQFLGRGQYFRKCGVIYRQDRQVMLVSFTNKTVHSSLESNYEDQHGTNPYRDLEQNRYSEVLSDGDCISYSKNSSFLFIFHDYTSVVVEIKRRNRKNARREQASDALLLADFALVQTGIRGLAGGSTMEQACKKSGEQAKI